MLHSYNNFVYDNPDYLILVKLETFNRTTSGKSWKSKPTKTEKTIYNSKNFQNYISAIPFFNNFGDGAYCRAQWSYTVAGYLPTVVTSVSPGRTTKRCATFTFVEKWHLLNRAGWRETEIVNNAKFWNMEVIDNKRYLYLFTDANGVTASGMFDFSHNKWRG